MSIQKKPVNPYLAWPLFAFAVVFIMAAGLTDNLFGMLVIGVGVILLLGVLLILFIQLISRLVRRFTTRAHWWVLTFMGVVLAAIATYLCFFWAPHGTLVTGHEFQGIVMRPGHYRGHTPANNWPVSKSDIMCLETDLQKYVGQKPSCMGNFIPGHLPEYRRRYHGIVQNGLRTIVVQMDHRNVTWRVLWILLPSDTMGGGYYFWHVTYKVDSRTFTDFSANAPQ